MIQIEKERFRPNETYFVENHSRLGWWVYRGNFPYATCTIIPNEDWSVIEMHHVIVFDKHQRRKGHGTRMIANVRRFFPNATIWVDTWDHSRSFWQAMVDQGYIDFIGNDYAWPCLIRIVSLVIRTESTRQGGFNQRRKKNDVET